MEKYNRVVKKPVSRRVFMKLAGFSALGAVLVACGDEPTVAIPTTTGTTSAAGTTAGTASGSGISTPATRPTATTRPATGVKPDVVAANYLKAWEEKRYEDMYPMLSASAQNFITRDKFVTRYQNIADEATIVSIQTKITTIPQIMTTNEPYEIPFSASFKTARAGDFVQQNTLQLVLESGNWMVDWRPSNIFTALGTLNLVRMFPDNSTRGDILDRNNKPLANQGNQYAVFVVPGRIENEDALLATLSQILSMDKTKIKNLYKDGKPDWRMDIKKLPSNTPQETINSLLAIKGVGVDESPIRAYPNGASAAHIVGYINAVNEDDLKKLAAKGYREDDVVGRVGVEAWGEDVLAGVKGGTLTVVQPDGKIVEKMAERNAIQGSKLILNIDLTIQKAAEKVLGDKVGSIVVMSPADGAVLALASFPSYDPNLFVQGITADQFNALNNDVRHPFQPRPYGGLLPSGSTFKVITMAAAMDKLGMKADASFVCTGHWTGLGEAFAKDCYVKTGHGKISLYEALVQSCDFVFYELGKKLDETDPMLLPTIARGFGLGTSTGIVGLYDASGQVPDPTWKKDKIGQAWVRGDAVNLAIGQGYFLATPLQMAAVYSALANSGPIPVPRVAARAEGATPQTFAPATKATIPVSAPTLTTIRQALQDVTVGNLGTARTSFYGSKVKVSGKTGTAESGKENPHAWFCCYAPSDKPKYTIVIALEEAGFGNEKAAPLARQLIDQLTF